MKLNSKKVTVEFEIASDAPWLLDQLENQGILDDLAFRAAHEFVRDLKKMNGFSGAKTDVRLSLTYTGEMREWESKRTPPE